MNRQFTKATPRLRRILLSVTASTAGLICSAHADLLQNQAVQGSSAQLQAAGYGLVDGGTVRVGIVEADDAFPNVYYGAGADNVTAPNSTLPNGNTDLPGESINFVQLPAKGGNPAGQLPRGTNAGSFPAAGAVDYYIGNHATEVTGVVMGQGSASAADIGIAPFATVQYGALENLNLGSGRNGQENAATTIQSVAQQPGTPIVNMSFGFSSGGGNTVRVDGSSLLTTFVDWAAGKYDTLMVVAGEEGGNGGAPSDSYNSINVAASGVRGSYNNGVFTKNNAGGVLNYGIASSYNTSNLTTDLSPITGYGRFKTDIIAPGGDPGPGAQLMGTFNSLPGASNEFQSTAGGQYLYSYTDAGGTAYYTQDSFTGAVTSQSSGIAGDTAAPNLAAPFPRVNPGPNLGGGDSVQSQTIAGTSFAAPLVSGAAALLYQEGNPNLQNPAFSTDHRLIKALLLNGATHFFNGSPLYEANGATPWTRVAGQGSTPLLAGTTAAQFGGAAPTVRPGLDTQLGTGMLDVTSSLDNYYAGRQAPGLVSPIGYDLNTVSAGAAKNTIVDAYTFIITSSVTFSATLCWDDPVAITGAGGDGSWNITSTLNRGTLTNLDLYLFQVNLFGGLGNNIDYSTSDIDNVEYLYDNLTPGIYQLDVANGSYAAPQDTIYGLAWMVPEPAAISCLAAAIPLLKWRRSRKVNSPH